VGDVEQRDTSKAEYMKDSDGDGITDDIDMDDDKKTTELSSAENQTEKKAVESPTKPL
jgi:hypothetical protein